MEKFIKKYENAIAIVFWSAVALLILLWHLVNVPIERDFTYKMQGYAIDANGNILAEFPITVDGTEYDFIIDRKGSGNLGWSGNGEITHMDQDATFIEFTCEKSSLTESFSDFFPLHWYPMLDQYARGIPSYINKTGFMQNAGILVINTDNRTLLWYNTHLIENAYIIGTTDPDADPWEILQLFSEHICLPELETAANNS